jgi:hypothetical protein
MLRGYNWCQMPMLAVIGAGVIKPYFPNWDFYVLAGIAFSIFLIVGLVDKSFEILNEENSYATEKNSLLMKGLFKEEKQ